MGGMVLADVRILVTGTRGKSGMVRLLAAALEACGLRFWARITGVVPTVLTSEGFLRIRRTAPTSVEEMRWWLRTLPGALDAVVLENSAVAPELQPLAGQWLHPTLTVWTNAHPDHQEVWGFREEDALRALFVGIPSGVPVVLGPELSTHADLCDALTLRNCPVHRTPRRAAPTVEQRQRDTALTACAALGLDLGRCLSGMETLPPDTGDFRVLACHGAQLASAFAANEPTSSEKLFASLGWVREETTLWYHHRRDRSGRLDAFFPWFQQPWRHIWITGALPWRSVAPGTILGNPVPGDFLRHIAPEDRIFGCGNVAGLPLSLLEMLGRECRP